MRETLENYIETLRDKYTASFRITVLNEDDEILLKADINDSIVFQRMPILGKSLIIEVVYYGADKVILRVGNYER